jgi:predicted GNAT family acetyltransferase
VPDGIIVLVCFFVAKAYRHQGLSSKVLQGAVEYASQQGTRIVEGCPIAPKVDHTPDIYAFTGMASTFKQLGFQEVARRSESRPIMRYFIDQ